ncbi:MAG TPA: sugar ABC transporter permease [Anaerolineae bacterium]|nr:sugar ABC transporter permease [Anaerolineae bacterium]
MAYTKATQERKSWLPWLRRGNQTMKQTTREAIYGYLFILPWVLGFVIFTVGPMIGTFVISLFDTDFLTKNEFVGFQWYRSMVGDTLVHKAFINTAIYAFVTVPAGTILALMIAVLLNQGIKGQSIWRTIYYLPSIVSGVAVAILWRWLYQPDVGLFNTLLSYVGIQGPRWVFSEEWAMPSIILVALWGAGAPMLIFLAGLQGIPTSLYEAAEIDGAGPITRFFYITIPMLTPTIFFNVVLSIIGSWQVFTQALILTEGGPNNATLTVVLHLYRTGFRNFYFGYASAQAWVLFLVVLIFVVLALRSASSWVQYERV